MKPVLRNQFAFRLCGSTTAAIIGSCSVIGLYLEQHYFGRVFQFVQHNEKFHTVKLTQGLSPPVRKSDRFGR